MNNMRSLIRYSFLASLLFISLSSHASLQKESNVKYYKKFQEVFERIEKEYVKEPEKQKLLDAAIEGMVASLDPHTGYFVDEDLEYFVSNTKGEFGGIGVEIIYEAGAIKVISPIDDLAAFKAGIKAGDYIVKVNNELISNLGFNKALIELRGAPGTKVKITVIREGQTKPLEFELTREIVKIKAVKSSLDNNIGYVRIATFSEKAPEELKKEMKNLLEQSKDHLDGIILDLRNNPGGLLEQGILVADYFMRKGVIVSTKGRSQNSEIIFSAKDSSEKAPNIPIIVLINGGSASASEIVAGALQESKRALLLGTKSYGKGSVQTFMPIDNRSAFKITTGIYYTPSGKSIQAEGITPDIVAEQAKVEYPKKDEDQFKFSEASFKNHIKNEQTKSSETTNPEETPKQKAPVKMSDMYLKDFQYAKAYDLLQGIIILEKRK